VRIQGLDLDQPLGIDQLKTWEIGQLGATVAITKLDWVPSDPGVDFWIRYENTGDTQWRYAIHFANGVTFARYIPPNPNVTFEQITLADLQGAAPSQTGRFPADPGQFLTLEPYIFAIKTSEGRLAKLALPVPLAWQGEIASRTYSNLLYLAPFVAY
jgi:hypothetical protein